MSGTVNYWVNKNKWKNISRTWNYPKWLVNIFGVNTGLVKTNYGIFGLNLLPTKKYINGVKK